MPATDRPRRITVSAALNGAEPNTWDLWALPTHASGAHVFEAPPIDPDAIRLDVERGYSKGFGLPAPSAPFDPPDAARALPGAPRVTTPTDARTIVTHRLTPALVDHLEAGANLVMLCSNAPGGVGSVAEWHFGCIPLIFERGPLHEGDADWIIDCLLVDLIANWCRAIPSEKLGIANDVEPIIRQVFTHDQDRPVMLDLLAAARVGKGTLVLSSLDHTTVAGRYLLARTTEWLNNDTKTTGTLNPQTVRAWTAPRP